MNVEVLVVFGAVRFVAADVEVRTGCDVGQSGRSRRERTARVDGRCRRNELKPTSLPVYSGGATPSAFSSGTEARAAWV